MATAPTAHAILAGHAHRGGRLQIGPPHIDALVRQSRFHRVHSRIFFELHP